eukprot:TRINITY_DN18699_c0_g1_i2.p1 TRINITY_DN18699_c0_g1~~TRINITY_DN18699_c0_g1_i2.p1  ORF type:complete len:373 (-),score=31.20 TRINITY_DN18699_c0_g1_i2:238-1356(-)
MGSLDFPFGGSGWVRVATLSLGSRVATFASLCVSANQNEQCGRRRRGGKRFAGLVLASTAATAATPVTASASEKKACCKGKKAETKEEPQKSFARILLEGAVAGGAAGVTVETVLYPIDTIKTRLQVARAGGGINFKGLYQGLSGNLVGVLPASAIFIGVYEPVKTFLARQLPDDLSVAAHLGAGAAGGAAASLVRVPTEVIKQRMQTGQFPTAVNAVKTILQKEGARGLYAGYGSFLLRDLPFDAIQFAIYEQLKIYIKKLLKRDLKGPEMAVVGAVSGAITGAVTTPLDVIKTRLMTQGTTGQYKGIIDCVRKTAATEGTMALFNGIGPRVMWIGIGGSIFFGVLEKTKELMHAQHISAAEAAATASHVL